MGWSWRARVFERKSHCLLLIQCGVMWFKQRYHCYTVCKISQWLDSLGVNHGLTKFSGIGVEDLLRMDILFWNSPMLFVNIMGDVLAVCFTRPKTSTNLVWNHGRECKRTFCVRSKQFKMLRVPTLQFIKWVVREPEFRRANPAAPCSFN